MEIEFSERLAFNYRFIDSIQFSFHLMCQRESKSFSCWCLIAYACSFRMVVVGLLNILFQLLIFVYQSFFPGLQLGNYFYRLWWMASAIENFLFLFSLIQGLFDGKLKKGKIPSSTETLLGNIYCTCTKGSTFWLSVNEGIISNWKKWFFGGNWFGNLCEWKEFTLTFSSVYKVVGNVGGYWEN